MTVAGRPCAISHSPRRIPSSVLPVAVGPATTTSGGRLAMAAYCTAHALPARLRAAHDPASDAEEPDQLRRPHGEHGGGRAARRTPYRLLPRTGAGRRGD